MNKREACKLHPGDGVLVGVDGGNSAKWRGAHSGTVVRVTGRGGVLVNVWDYHNQRRLGEQWFAYSHVQHDGRPTIHRRTETIAGDDTDFG
jgi:hypothetical protein